MKDSGRRWLIAAVGLFAFLLVGWVLLALQLNSALAGPLPFGPGLMSKLSADYRADEGGRSVALIALSILEPAMQALGLTDEEAAAAHESLELAMSQPVPTATAMDFDGAAPFTATPTVTITPLPTDPPTPTPTNTRRPPTKTPKPTKTPEPKDTEGPAPTDTSVPTGIPTAIPTPDDNVEPSILTVAFDLTPPGPITSCRFYVIDMNVFDPAPSSGISIYPVFARVTYPDSFQDYFTLSIFSGGFVSGPGSDWDAHYRDSVAFSNPSHVVVFGETIQVELKVKDDAGNGWVITSPVSFTVEDDCPS